jgi:hypothetical protein
MSINLLRNNFYLSLLFISILSMNFSALGLASDLEKEAESASVSRVIKPFAKTAVYTVATLSLAQLTAAESLDKEEVFNPYSLIDTVLIAGSTIIAADWLSNAGKNVIKTIWNSDRLFYYAYLRCYQSDLTNRINSLTPSYPNISGAIYDLLYFMNKNYERNDINLKDKGFDLVYNCGDFSVIFSKSNTAMLPYLEEIDEQNASAPLQEVLDNLVKGEKIPGVKRLFKNLYNKVTETTRIDDTTSFFKVSKPHHQSFILNIGDTGNRLFIGIAE